MHTHWWTDQMLVVEGQRSLQPQLLWTRHLKNTLRGRGQGLKDELIKLWRSKVAGTVTLPIVKAPSKERHEQVWPKLIIQDKAKPSTMCVSGLGVEGERVGERERHPDGAVHCGAEQTSITRRGRPLHSHHQQRHGVWLPLALQLHRLELIRTWHHDHHPGRDGYGEANDVVIPKYVYMSTLSMYPMFS